MEYEFEYDSYDIDISSIKDSDKVCWQYTNKPPMEEEDSWFEATGEMFCKLSPITEALATSSDYVHMNKLKPSNLMEWYYRLEALFDAGVAFMFTDTKEGEVPIRLNIHDLKDHLGLRIDTKPYSSEKFDRCVRNLRMQNHLKELL